MTDALKYDYAFDPNDDSTAARVCRLVGEHKQVLELGCAAGAMSKVLSQHYHCAVTGVEFNAEAAQLARAFCKEVLVADLDQADSLRALDQSFEVLVFADVLEHLRDPEARLREALHYLSPTGHVVVSVPNIAHNGVLAQLWCGEFNYAETGLLDRTHIHFFTANTLQRMLERVGLEVDHIETIDTGPFHPEFAAYWDQLPPEIYTLFQHNTPGQPYQIIMRAKRPVVIDDTPSPSLWQRVQQRLRGTSS